MYPLQKLANSVLSFPDSKFEPGRFTGKFWSLDEEPTSVAGWTRSQNSSNEETVKPHEDRQFLLLDRGLLLNEVTVSSDFASKEQARGIGNLSSQGHPFTKIISLMSDLTSSEPIISEVFDLVSLELWMAMASDGNITFACHLHSQNLREQSEPFEASAAKMRRAAKPIEHIKTEMRNNRSLVEWLHPYMNGVSMISTVQFFEL